MDTVHLGPRIKIKTPEALRWVIVGFSFLLVAAGWWISDLWRIIVWTRDQIEIDGTMPRRQLTILSLFAFVMALCIVFTTRTALTHGWYFIEWAMLVFVFCFLYGVATFIRIVR